jgi:hypothetical protein
MLGSLAVVIGLGHVEERTSFGLTQIVNGLLMLASAWSQWAFSTMPPEHLSARSQLAGRRRTVRRERSVRSRPRTAPLPD